MLSWSPFQFQVATIGIVRFESINSCEFGKKEKLQCWEFGEFPRVALWSELGGIISY
jgi:hypothetical protein